LVEYGLVLALIAVTGLNFSSHLGVSL